MRFLSRLSPRFALLALVAALGASAHAIVATTGASTPIDTTYSFVGYVDGFGGSAVAVGPHTFLTVNHNIPGGELGHSITMGGVTYAVGTATAAPDILLGDGRMGHVDLTLVTVNATLPGYYSIGTGLTSTSLTMVGYGNSGHVADDGKGYVDDNSQDSNRHVGTNTYSFSQDFYVAPGPSSNGGAGTGGGPLLVSYLKTAGDALILHGDSGGGWFQGNTLVGISSFTGSTNATNTRLYGFASANNGVPYYVDAAIDLTDPRLKSFLGGANPVPEPGTWAALGLGTLAFLRRRRR